MKILEVCSYLYPALAYGGPAKVVYDLSVELSKKNNEVTIYTSDVFNQNRRIKNNERLKVLNNLKVKYFKNISNFLAYRYKFFTSFGMVLKFFFNHSKFNLVHLHDLFIISHILIGYLALLFKIPLIISPHGVLDLERLKRRTAVKKILYLLLKPLLTRANYLVATSESEAKNLRQLGFDNVITVYNAVPSSGIKPSHEYQQYFNNSKTTLLYIGRLHLQKGLVELIQAYCSNKSDYSLLIAGPDDGIKAKLQRLVEKHNLTDVHILDYVDEENKKELFSLADIFIYPSYSEGFSIAILEAMRAGLPIIITDRCNFPNFHEQEIGWIVNLNNLSSELIQIHQELNLQPQLLRTMGDNAKKVVKEKYSIASMANELENIYTHVAV